MNSNSLVRRLLLVVPFSAAAVLGIPSGALAAGFDIHACETSYATSANNAFVGQADPGMTVYADCPAGDGIVTRNVFDGGATPSRNGAYAIFDAPSGTTISSMDFDAGLERNDCGYSVGLFAGGRDLGGTLVWGVAAGQDCDGSQARGPGVFFPVRWSVNVGAERVRLQTRCASGGTCSRNGVSSLRLRNVLLHITDYTAPTISGGRGQLWSAAPGRWLAGTHAIGFDGADGAGIKEQSLQVDGREIARKTIPCDFSRPVPCAPSSGLDQQFATSGFGADGTHRLTLLATDAAGNTSTTQRDIHIDNTAPDPPTGLVADGGDGWRRTNAFTVRWTNPAGAGAPIAGAQWKLCRTDDPGRCTGGSRTGAGLTTIEGLSVPGAGAWTLKLWLVDAAGNQEERLAAPPITLRYDETSPEVELASLSAEDPTLVSAPASDAGSGIVGGQISIRRRGADAWRPLPTTLEGTTLRARIDDERLGDGDYELQARADDAAGNQRTTTTYGDGKPATVHLPLRLKTKLSAGVRRRVGRSTRLLRTVYAAYGQHVRVRGRLVTPEGNPMQGAEIKAFTQIRDGHSPPRLAATTTTSRTGYYSFVVLKGPSRTVRVEYPGAGQIRGATKRLVLYVRARTTIRPSRRRLTNGEVLRFSGRVITGRIPVKGKLVELKVLNRGKWRTFATTRASRRGSWSYDYRFDGTRGLQRYRFRASIPRETGYPFAAGESHDVVVQVRGT